MLDPAQLVPTSGGPQGSSIDFGLPKTTKCPPTPGIDACGDEDVFTKGRLTFQSLTGFYPSQSTFGAINPTLDLLPISFRLGTMLNTPKPDGRLLRGNWEVFGEWVTAPVIKGYANIVVGPSFLLRRNFVQPDCRLVPYIQAGAGLVYSNAAKDQVQDAISLPIEFSLQAQCGLHYRVSEHWSIDAEGGLFHVSNAGLGDRNGGLNAVGGTIGLSYYFGTIMKWPSYLPLVRRLP
jgi:hypothetical protein